MTPRTWADGFGVWHAEVAYGPDCKQEAERLIAAELDARGDRGPGYRVSVTEVRFNPGGRTIVYREARAISPKALTGRIARGDHSFIR